jgi:hypothetical protein
MLPAILKEENMLTVNTTIKTFDDLSKIVADYLVQAAVNCHSDMMSDDMTFASRRGENPEFKTILQVTDIAELAKSTFHDCLEDLVYADIEKKLEGSQLSVDVTWRLK